jgi:FAD dependent oxidoreductase TIGR03364
VVTVAKRPRPNFATVLNDLDATLQGERVVVVGGGIFGTMHALFALARGASVVHLERDLAPSGASVRNFGLIWVSGRAVGRELTLALRARELWQEVALGVPSIGFRANGSLTLLANEQEREVARLALARDDAEARQFELLTAPGVLERNPALRGDYLGGLYCALDAAVESRVALGALRTYMENTGRYEYLPGHELVGVVDHAAIDHRGVHYGGDHVVLCLGATLSGFGAELFEHDPLRKVRLYMAETEPLAQAMTTSVANGDSFRYYPGFAEIARDVLDEQPPLAADFAIQLLCQQRLHGGLTIGDTHEPETPGLFETLDRPMEIIEGAARRVIGPAMPRIERRWSCVYHQVVDPTPNEIYFRKQVARGVSAVTGAGGRGMTLAPAIAEESFQ